MPLDPGATSPDDQRVYVDAGANCKDEGGDEQQRPYGAENDLLRYMERSCEREVRRTEARLTLRVVVQLCREPYRLANVR